MESIGLGLSLPLWITIPLIGILLPIVWWSYRTSRPLLTSGRRIGLTALRSLGIVALILTLSDLFFSHQSFRTELPSIYILLDASKSMAQMSGERSRFDIGRDIASKIQESFAEERVHFALFSDSIQMSGRDTEAFDAPSGSPTDLSIPAAPFDVERIGLTGAIFLISDGHHNSGEDPSARWSERGVPVIAILPGDQTIRNDVRVQRITTNRIGRVGVEQLVAVSIDGVVANQQSAEVILRSAKKTLASRRLTLLPGIREYEIAIPFRPTNPGTTLLTVEISGVSEERQPANNVRRTVVEVPDEKVNLLLIGGAPGPDLAFIRRKLESMPDLFVTSMIMVGLSGMRVDAKKVTSAELIALVNYPTSTTPKEELQTLGDEIRRRALPLLVAFGPNTDLQKLEDIDDLLPMSINPDAPIRKVARVRATSELRSRMEDARTSFEDLEPLTLYRSSTSMKPSTFPLLLSNDEDRTPVMVSMETPHPVTMISGWGLWRWELYDEGRGEARGVSAPPVLEEFITRSIRALGRAGKSSRFTLTIDPPSSLLGEKIVATSEVYSEDLHPLINAEVSVEISGPVHRTLSLGPLGNGLYAGSLSGLLPGQYRYSGEGRIDGSVIGKANGTFLVEDRQVEDITLGPNVTLMKSIASRSKGYFGSDEETDSLIALIKKRTELSARSVEVKSETSLRDSLLFLLSAMLLFCVEWILRRRWGLL